MNERKMKKKKRRDGVGMSPQAILLPKLTSTKNSSTTTSSSGATVRLYHCDLCKKDLSSEIRIKCAECEDFDMCVNCFYEGIETRSHKRNHDYSVVNDLSIPLFAQNWGCEEEKMLLEGIKSYGLGNWKTVAEHVSTKNKFQCEYHYWNTYIDVPTFPLPTSNRSGKKDSGLIKEPVRMSDEHVKKDDRGMLYTIMKKSNPPLKPYEVPQAHKFDLIKKGKGGEVLGTEVGYIPLRKGFTTDHCEKAENKIASMVIGPSYHLKQDSVNYTIKKVKLPNESTDGKSKKDDVSYIEKKFREEEFKELKRNMLKSYDHKVREREKRNRFVIDRGLYDFHKIRSQQKKRSKEEKEIFNTYKKYMRFMKKEEFDNFLNGLMKEVQLTKQIRLLQYYRKNGIRTISQAKRFEIEKKIRDPNYQPGSKKSTKKNENLEYLEKLSSGGSLVEILSEKEVRMIHALEVTISQYLLIKDVMIKESHRLGYLSRNTAKKMFRLDPNISGKIYDFCVYCGWINPDKRILPPFSMDV